MNRVPERHGLADSLAVPLPGETGQVSGEGLARGSQVVCRYGLRVAIGILAGLAFSVLARRRNGLGTTRPFCERGAAAAT